MDDVLQVGRQSACVSPALPYLLFLPAAYGRDPTRRWPAILYLHGIGERGNGLTPVKRHGIAKIVENKPAFPFIAISPQCPADKRWGELHSALNTLLDEVIARYNVAEERLYLTGNSMGGYGTWSLAAAYPRRFAALAPICAGGDPTTVAALHAIPVWAFHGADDPIVPLSAGQQMVATLRASGGAVRFTVYPETAHDSWTRTYDNPELYDWFLRHTRQT